jgi:hypothetical protein
VGTFHPLAKPFSSFVAYAGIYAIPPKTAFSFQLSAKPPELTADGFFMMTPSATLMTRIRCTFSALLPQISGNATSVPGAAAGLMA